MDLKRIFSLVALFLAFLVLLFSLSLVRQRQIPGPRGATEILSCSFEDTLVCGGKKVPLDQNGLSFADGIINKAVLVDKNDSLLSYLADEDTVPRQGSLEMWVKFLFDLSPQPGNNHVLAQIFSENNPIFSLTLRDGNKIEFGLNGQTLTAPPRNSRKNRWHYLVTSWGDQGMKIYQDGVLQASNEYKQSLPTLHGKIYVGSTPQGTAIAQAAIDELKIWPQPLNEEQILSSLNFVQGSRLFQSSATASPIEADAGSRGTLDINVLLGEDIPAGYGLRFLFKKPEGWNIPQPNNGTVLLVNDTPNKELADLIGCASEPVVGLYCEALAKQNVPKNTRLTLRLGAKVDGSADPIFLFPSAQGKTDLSVAIDNGAGSFFELPYEKRPYLFLK